MTRPPRRRGASLAFAFALMSASLPAEEPRVQRDLAYLGPDREEKLDAYLPPPAYARPAPAVLLIHGGGWRGGDKADGRERGVGATLSAHGYAVFSINYRLNLGEKDPRTGAFRVSRLAWPQNFHDCKSALRFIRAESARFGVDPARVAVMGSSAGGHLAMLVGATARHAEINRQGLYVDQSNAVSCIVDFYGDHDIRGRAVSPFAGSDPAQTAANEEAASPVTYFDRHLPPLLIVHGTADEIVPVERSRLLARHLENLGASYLYLEIGGAPHSFGLQPRQADLRPVVLSFLAQYLGAPALSRP